MAKGKALELSIKIAGKLDKSLLSALNQSQRRVSGFSTTLSKIGTAGLAAMGTMATGTVAALANCTNEAIKFRNEMADVTKYVNGLADRNGKIVTENYDKVSRSILKITTEVPILREDLTELAAIMGQTGKTMDEMFILDDKGNVIGGLLKDAAVMASAWDITAKEAADYSAKWENAFHMSHTEVMALADQINYLGANSATTAAEIANAVNQAASLGQLAGIDPSTTAALADAMLATGVASDRVGTSIKRMALNLSKGSDMTKKQKAVLAELGMTAEGVTKGLQKDSIGMLDDIFRGIGNLPEERRLNAVGQLFGIWAAEGGAKIVGNLGVYEEALRLVREQRDLLADESWSSMQREFAIKTDTPEARKAMRQAAFNMLRIDIGDAFVPVHEQIDIGLRDLFLSLDEQRPQIQQLAGTLAELASKGISKLGDALEKALPYIQKTLDYLNNHGDEAVETAGKIAAVFLGMKFAPAAEGLFRGAGGIAGSLIGGLTGAPKAADRFLFGRELKKGARKGGLIPGISSFAKNTAKRFGNWKSGMAANLKMMGPNTGLGGIIRDARHSFWATAALNGGAVSPSGGILPAIPGQALGDGNILGPLFAAGSSILGNLNLGGTAKGIAGILAPVTKMFGGMVAGAAPVVLAISGIVLAVDLIGEHSKDVRKIIVNVFGERGGDIFDVFAGKAKTAVDTIRDLFSEGGMTRALTPLRETIYNSFGDKAGSAFGGLITILESVSGVLRRIADFARGTLQPIIEGIFNFVSGTVVPKLLDIFTASAPFIAQLFTAMGDAVMNVFDLIGNVLTTVGPIVETIFSGLLDAGMVVVPAVIEVITGLFNSISAIIDNIQLAFGGITTFLKGVFTGDINTALQGISDLFSGIFGGLVEIVKAPLNAIIDLFNGIFERIGQVKVPDWVPTWLGGGKTFTMPHLERLAEGGFTHGPSIAGEAGMEAVISFQRQARRENIALWQQAGQMLGIRRHDIADIGDAGRSYGGVVFAPQITINGNADRNEVEAGIRMSFEEFKRYYERLRREQSRYGFASV